ncbi:MAG: hypothetical protein AAF687_01175 [Pseudomonadota bacterium]
MSILLGLLAVLGAIMVFVDFSSLVPVDSESFRVRRRAGTIETLIGILPWIGGVALVTVVAVLPTLIRKRVEIEISEKGIAYPPALDGTLPWDRIDRIAVHKMALYRVLSVYVKDAATAPIKPMARKIAELNKTTGDLGDINIETLRSDGDFDELVAAVSKYKQVEPLP